jgi:hypothetical protein
MNNADYKIKIVKNSNKFDLLELPINDAEILLDTIGSKSPDQYFYENLKHLLLQEKLWNKFDVVDSNIIEIKIRHVLTNKAIIPIYYTIKNKDEAPKGTYNVRLSERKEGVIDGKNRTGVIIPEELISLVKLEPQWNSGYLKNFQNTYGNIYLFNFPINKKSLINGDKFLKDSNLLEIKNVDELLEFLSYMQKYLLLHGMQTIKYLPKSDKIIKESLSANILDNLEKKYPSNEAIDFLREQAWEILEIKIPEASLLTIMSYLNNYNLLNIYSTARILGIHDYSVVQQIAAIKAKIKNNESKAEFKKTQNDNNLLSLQYIKIAKEKLPTKNYNSLIKNIDEDPYLLLSPKKLLKSLPINVEKIISTEYNRRKGEWEAKISNKCPHVKLAHKLHLATGQKELKNIMYKLRSYFKKLPKITKKPSRFDDDWIQCKNCNFNIICPHVFDSVNLRLTGATYSEIQDILFNKYTNNTARNVNDINFQYCMICGEVLASMEMNEIDISGDDITLVSRVIWKESHELFSNLKIEPPIAKEIFTNTLIGDIKFHVGLLYSDLIKKKSKKAELKINLYAILYSYAYVLNLIRSSDKAKSKNISKITFLNIEFGSPLTTYFKQIIIHLQKTKNALIDKIGDITTEYIKNLLIEFYKNLAKDQGEKVIIADNVERRNVLRLISIDSIFNGMLTMYQVAGVIPIELDYTKKGAVGDTIKTILNYSLNELSDVNLYKNITIPENLIKNLDKSPPMLQYFILSYMLVTDYEKFKTHKKHFDQLRLEIYNKFTKRLWPVVVHKEYTSTIFYLSAGKLTDVYSIKTGKKYVWDTYVYKSGNKILEFSKKDSVNRPKNAKLIDMKDSKNGVFKSQLVELQSAANKEKIEKIHKVNLFYEQFSYRCPEGGVHIFKKDICTKCKIKKNQDGNLIRTSEYYSKYSKLMDKESRAAENKIELIKKEKMQLPEKIQWKYDGSILLKLGEVLNIPINMLNAMGIMEDRSMEDIKNGINPPDYSINSYMKLKSYYQNLTIAYNNLRFLYKLGKNAKYFEKIQQALKESKYPISKVEHLSKILPRVPEKFNKQLFSQIANRESYRDMSQFIIENIAKFILRSLNVKDVKIYELLRDYFSRVLQLLIDHESLFAKPGDFNWIAVFGYGDEIADMAEFNPSEGVELGEDMEIEITEEGVYSKFSLDGADYAGDESADAVGVVVDA